jgi:hypothetical protein
VTIALFPVVPRLFHVKDLRKPLSFGPVLAVPSVPGL